MEVLLLSRCLHCSLLGHLILSLGSAPKLTPWMGHRNCLSLDVPRFPAVSTLWLRNKKSLFLFWCSQISRTHFLKTYDVVISLNPALRQEPWHLSMRQHFHVSQRALWLHFKYKWLKCFLHSMTQHLPSMCLIPRIWSPERRERERRQNEVRSPMPGLEGWCSFWLRSLCGVDSLLSGTFGVGIPVPYRCRLSRIFFIYFLLFSLLSLKSPLWLI